MLETGENGDNVERWNCFALCLICTLITHSYDDMPDYPTRVPPRLRAQHID
jgi:hypothetical protein